MNTKNNQPLHYQNYTLLIIDDNPNNLGVIVDYLGELGFEIVVAKNGEIGLKRAKTVQPDMILLDVMMPGIDGFETCRRLKADDQTADIPVIFMTALDDAEDKINGFEVGGVDYVTKPIQQEEVLARITTHLRIRDLTRHLNVKVQELTQTRQELLQKVEELNKTRQELVHSEKMASLGRLVAGFAHELNTPLGVAVGSASALQQEIKKINRLVEQDEVDVDEFMSALDTINQGFTLSFIQLRTGSQLSHQFQTHRRRSNL
jgi:two-component system NtrC family sensor kinase